MFLTMNLSVMMWGKEVVLRAAVCRPSVYMYVEGTAFFQVRRDWNVCIMHDYSRYVCARCIRKHFMAFRLKPFFGNAYAISANVMLGQASCSL